MTDKKTEIKETTPINRNNDLSSKKRKKGKSLWGYATLTLKVFFVIFCFINIAFAWAIFKNLSKWDIEITKDEIYAVRKDTLLPSISFEEKLGLLTPQERLEKLSSLYDLTKSKPKKGVETYKEHNYIDGELYTRTVIIFGGKKYTVDHNKSSFNNVLDVYVRQNGSSGESSRFSLSFSKHTGHCLQAKIPSKDGGARKEYYPHEGIYDIGIIEVSQICDRTLIDVLSYYENGVLLK